MARAGPALAFLVALPLLAGCAGPVGPGNAIPDVDPAAQAGLTVPPSHLEAGTFYAFHHVGGTLGIGVLPGGHAQVELFDGADQRIGQVPLSDQLAGGTLQLQNMDAGDYVIRTLAVNGTLRIESGGAAPALRPLASHVERVVLMTNPRGTVPGVPLGLPGGSPPEERSVDVTLKRAPTSVRVLVAGDYASLQVDLRSALGPVVTAQSTGFAPFNGFGGGFVEVSSAFRGENARDGHLTGRVQAQDLRGSLVLEASSFSRAEPLALAAAPAQGAARFSYGTLPDAPVRFQTGPRASQILLHGNPSKGGNRTWVALFDDHGRRLGTLSIEAGTSLAVPVAASTGYIAVRLRGNATLGANAAPGDFELHPLAVREQTLPDQASGMNGEYDQGSSDADGTGAFAIHPVYAPPPAPGGLPFTQGPPQGCSVGTLVSVTQGGETLGHWEDDVGRLAEGDAGLRLRDGPLKVLDDGFGGTNCAHLAVVLESFQA